MSVSAKIKQRGALYGETNVFKIDTLPSKQAENAHFSNCWRRNFVLKMSNDNEVLGASEKESIVTTPKHIYERSLQVQSYLNCWFARQRFFSVLVSLWDRSPVGFRLSKTLFRNVPGTALENVRTRGFKSNSSCLDETPKIRNSVLLGQFFSDLSSKQLRK